jgi:hypothetical protein
VEEVAIRIRVLHQELQEAQVVFLACILHLLEPDLILMDHLAPIRLGTLNVVFWVLILH